MLTKMKKKAEPICFAIIEKATSRRRIVAAPSVIVAIGPNYYQRNQRDGRTDTK